jgi:hypothetical protein
VKDYIKISIIENPDFIHQISLDVFGRQTFDRFRQWHKIRGDDSVAAALCQPLHQRLSNLSASARHKDQFFTHSALLCARMKHKNIRRYAGRGSCPYAAFNRASLRIAPSGELVRSIATLLYNIPYRIFVTKCT